jgi:hypothetical protein
MSGVRVPSPSYGLRSCQATIRKVVDGYTVTVVLRAYGRTVLVVDKAVDNAAEAQTVVRQIAAQYDLPRDKVEVVSS